MTGITQINSEVFVSEGSLVQLDEVQVDVLKQQAKRNVRQRARICAHRNPEDRLHEMLIVLTKEAYIRPHKHLNKTESLHVIDGTALVIYFDDDGNIGEVVRIGQYKSGHQFYVRNEDSRYHMQIIMSDYLVFHEVTNGPFNRSDTLFAPWAPEETEIGRASCRERV